MAKIKIVIDRQGVRDMLHEAPIVAECKKHADRIYSACGGVDGYEMTSVGGVRRQGYQVTATRYPAIQDNLSNNTIEKAIGSA